MSAPSIDVDADPMCLALDVSALSGASAITLATVLAQDYPVQTQLHWADGMGTLIISTTGPEGLGADLLLDLLGTTKEPDEHDHS